VRAYRLGERLRLAILTHAQQQAALRRADEEIALSMNPMPPNILTSVTPLTPDSAERTARISSGSGASDWARDRDEAFGIALSLARLSEQPAKAKQ